MTSVLRISMSSIPCGISLWSGEWRRGTRAFLHMMIDGSIRE
jgi:hypothetical protein